MSTERYQNLARINQERFEDKFPRMNPTQRVVVAAMTANATVKERSFNNFEQRIIAHSAYGYQSV